MISEIWVLSARNAGLEEKGSGNREMVDELAGAYTWLTHHRSHHPPPAHGSSCLLQSTRDEAATLVFQHARLMRHAQNTGTSAVLAFKKTNILTLRHFPLPPITHSLNDRRMLVPLRKTPGATHVSFAAYNAFNRSFFGTSPLNTSNVERSARNGASSINSDCKVDSYPVVVPEAYFIQQTDTAAAALRRARSPGSCTGGRKPWRARS